VPGRQDLRQLLRGVPYAADLSRQYSSLPGLKLPAEFHGLRRAYRLLLPDPVPVRRRKLHKLPGQLPDERNVSGKSERILRGQELQADAAAVPSAANSMRQQEPDSLPRRQLPAELQALSQCINLPGLPADQVPGRLVPRIFVGVSGRFRLRAGPLRAENVQVPGRILRHQHAHMPDERFVPTHAPHQVLGQLLRCQRHAVRSTGGVLPGTVAHPLSDGGLCGVVRRLSARHALLDQVASQVH
jgi:hypothetical protein